MQPYRYTSTVIAGNTPAHNKTHGGQHETYTEHRDRSRGVKRRSRPFTSVSAAIAVFNWAKNSVSTGK